MITAIESCKLEKDRTVRAWELRFAEICSENARFREALHFVYNTCLTRKGSEAIRRALSADAWRLP